MNKSIDFSLSWGNFAYNVEKSYVAIHLAYFLAMLFNDGMMGQNFVRLKICDNLVRI